MVLNQSLFVAQFNEMEDPRNSKRNNARWNVDKVRFHLKKPMAPNREVRRIDTVLKDVIDGLEEPQSEDILVLRDAWPKLAGPQIAKHSQPVALEHFTLCVSIDHPGWLPEMQRSKRILLQKLQSQYPDLRIKQLHFALTHR